MPRIRAKPVHILGEDFRSKLEATYAVLFDLLDFYWVYEPMTDSELPAVRGWLPDFQLIGSNGECVLVDVKPWSRSLPASDLKLRGVTRKVRQSWKDGGNGLFRSDEFGHNPFIWITCGELDFFHWDLQMAGWGSHIHKLVAGEKLLPFDMGWLLMDELFFDEGRDEWEPYLALAGVKDITELWAACRRVVNLRGKPLPTEAVEPWWNTEPKCDGKGDCYCDPSEHECPECGGFMWAGFDVCYSCRD